MGEPSPIFAPRNRLLAALPADSLLRVHLRLSLEEMSICQVLHRREVPIETVYFPEYQVTSGTRPPATLRTRPPPRL
jgi:hypothetical protein